MITAGVKFEPNLKTEKGLKKIPDDVLYSIARQTLDLSYTTIPLSGEKNAGKLRNTSMAHGVRKGYGGYFIGSFTNYAQYVWKMNDERTNWTTPGTHSQWYARTLKEKGKMILDNAVNKTWKENM